MSILLEALRKTEKNKKKQQVPSIHSEEHSRPGSEPVKTGPLVAMIAVALCITGWFTWRQYELPEGVYQPPVTLPTTGVRTGSTQTGVEKTRAAKDTTGSKPDQAAVKPLTDKTPSPQARTPVETYQAPVAGAAGPATTQTEPSAGKISENVVAEAGGSSRNATAIQNSAGASAKPASSAPRAAGTTPQPAKKDGPHIPEPIGYWELPDAVRAEVPEIRYSVLVYNNDPAQRFVLIDGQRLVEGDSPKPGLVVEEIRRNGVIFSYRLYRFLVSR